MNDEIENTNIDESLLASLEHHARIELTEYCSEAEMLWALAKDPHCDVRMALAENHNIDSDILALLADDENPYVAWRARKTIKRLSVGSTLSGNFSWPETHNTKRRADRA
ncbi:hypothetical protein BH11CYA1_BH11CYA1_28510 [soil metagenome]